MSENSSESIVNIFNNMNFERKNINETNECITTNSNGDLGYEKSVEEIFEEAVNAQIKWKNINILRRADILHKIGRNYPKNNDLGSNYFYFYSDFISVSDEFKKWQPVGIVLLILPADFPVFIFSAIVSAVLAAGCAIVIVSNTEKVKRFENIFSDAGLPNGLYTVIPDCVKNEEILLSLSNKIVVFGDFFKVKNIFIKPFLSSFIYLCPNKTSAILLESCDIDAAIEKLLKETWDLNSKYLWGVSTIVVQESIYQKFFTKILFYLQQFDANNSFVKNKINSDIISQAVKTGAEVIHAQGVTIFFNYQNQEIQPDLPIIKVLVCRTAKEGVNLLSNFSNSLGTSVWSEVSSEALEVADTLNSNNVWINCHGVASPFAPIHPAGSSGNCILGGSEGIFQYMSFEQNLVNINKEEMLLNNDFDLSSKNYFEEKLANQIQSSFIMFKTWNVSNKKNVFNKISEYCEKQQELECYSDIISLCGHWGSIMTSTDSISNCDFFTIKKKIPLGVIAILINSSAVHNDTIITLIFSAAAFGNSIILLLQSDQVEIMPLLTIFKNLLPNNLIQIVTEMNSVFFVASHPYVQAFWIYGDSTFFDQYYLQLKKCLSTSLKKYWLVPKTVPLSYYILEKQCLKNKVIWLTKVDQIK